MRYKGLDALRGIAAALVMGQHLLAALGFVAPIDLGKLGVVLFFLISGFVIPFSLQRGVGAFIVGRAFRLLPVLWLSMVFCVAVGAPLEGPRHLFANAFMLNHALSEEYLSPPYWTLNWELYFYAATAFLFFVRLERNHLALGVSALVSTYVAIMKDGQAIALVFMFAGAMLRLSLLEKCRAAAAWLGAISIMIAVYVAIWYARDFPIGGYLFVMAVACAAFVALWDRAAHPVLLWLGSISYPLYLLHLPIILILPQWALPIGGLALPLIAASAVHRWVEQPMIAFGKSLTIAGAYHDYKVRPPCAPE